MLAAMFNQQVSPRSLRKSFGKWRLIVAVVVGIVVLGITALPSAAQREATAVTGYANVFGGLQSDDPDAGFFFFDAAGNLHRQHLKAKGAFILTGDRIDVNATQTVWITGMKTSDGGGATSARVLVESAAGETLWQGNLHGHFDVHYLYGNVLLHGEGLYEGLTAKLEIWEECVYNTANCANPSEYLMKGTVYANPGG
ncbi:MAG: hypothetical protein R3300_08875 [Candidatus Promineifilaceae bacterium]|nr:hypothetical protein [Candidatus Promineifilaceae bacterium]